MSVGNRSLALSSAMHFLVDGICACCLFLMAGILIDGNAGVAFVTYNVLAFMTQPITGWLADRLWNKTCSPHYSPSSPSTLEAIVPDASPSGCSPSSPSPLAAIVPDASPSGCSPSSPSPLEAIVPDASPSGCSPFSLLRASLLFLSLGSILAAITASFTMYPFTGSSAAGSFLAWLATPVFLLIAIAIGIGNSLFHVWGGKRTAMESGNDIRSLGIFVSTGSLGLTIGILFHSWWLLAILLLAYVGCVWPHPRPLSQGEGSGHLCDDTQPLAPQQVYTPLSLGEGSGVRPVGVRPVGVRLLLSLLALMLIVLFRSYYGETFTWGFDKDMALTLGITLCAMTGKATGGWFVRGLGLWQSCALILVGIIACACFRTDNVGIMLAGIYLINTTMPITLWLANRLLPGREGLAFGLLAAVLVPGYLLAVTL